MRRAIVFEHENASKTIPKCILIELHRYMAVNHWICASKPSSFQVSPRWVVLTQTRRWDLFCFERMYT